MNKKRILLFILCLLMAVFLPFNAAAADRINTTEKCSFSLSFIVGEEEAAGVDFKLYRVADISSSNKYSVTEKFASYPVSYKNIDNHDSWRNLSQTLLGYVVADKLQADATSKTTADGSAYFSQLPVGLYLVIGSQYISNQSAQLVCTPQVFMISLPSLDVSDNWNYDVSSDVKYDITFEFNPDDPKYGNNPDIFDLDFLKIWNDNDNPNRPQEIMVEIYCNDRLYDTIALNKDNNWKYTLKNLNKTFVWVVKEKSVETGYTVCVERQENRFVLTNTMEDTPNGDTPNGDTPKDDNPKDKNPIKPPQTNGSTLPQTGLLWWPVPCLLAGGLLIMIIGILCRRGAVDEK